MKGDDFGAFLVIVAVAMLAFTAGVSWSEFGGMELGFLVWIGLAVFSLMVGATGYVLIAYYEAKRAASVWGENDDGQEVE